MANLQALCNKFKVDLLNGAHSFGTALVTRTTSLSADTFYAALYYAVSTINAAIDIYTSTGEVTSASSSNYTAGGWPIIFNAPGQSTAASTAAGGSVAYTTPTAAITINSLTATAFDCVLFYNKIVPATPRAISVHTFGSQTITNGTFVLTMPANDGLTGLIRLT